jgi:hypothetical protein
MELRPSEWVVLGYLAYLVVTAHVAPVATSRRRTIVSAAAIIAIVVWLAASRPASASVLIVRDWAPGVWLLAGYWMSGLLFVRPNATLEAWLLRSDAWLFRRLGLDRFVARSPRPLLESLELAYLCCYPLIPAGLAALYVGGADGQADRYWTVVLASEFSCYAALPWLQSRPPRALERRSAIDERLLSARRFNLWILRHGSIQVNTLPSAHTAGAVAAALALAETNPGLGGLFGLVAAGIAAGSVVGRYHYGVDAIAGAGVSVTVWILSRLSGR